METGKRIGENMAKQPKKLLIINILRILQKYSDENHRLSQKQIQEILRRDYEMEADRKAIHRNIMELRDCGYPIECEEKIRKVTLRDPTTGENVQEEQSVASGFYLVHTFTDGELRLLIDGLLFSRHVHYQQCQQLVEKLESLGSLDFRSRISHIIRQPDRPIGNRELFLNIELLNEAISTGKKVRFHYVEYGTDKALHRRCRQDGTAREYVITPYQMATREGKYYVICNNDSFNTISNYRVDRIQNLKILDEPGRPFESLEGANGQRLDMAVYMREHPYMYASENLWVKFWVKRAMIGDIVEIFGNEVRFLQEDEEGAIVSVHTNAMAMRHFAQSFAPDVVVLEPRSLRQTIKKKLKESLACYEESTKPSAAVFHTSTDEEESQ